MGMVKQKQNLTAGDLNFMYKLKFKRFYGNRKGV